MTFLITTLVLLSSSMALAKVTKKRESNIETFRRSSSRSSHVNYYLSYYNENQKPLMVSIARLFHAGFEHEGIPFLVGAKFLVNRNIKTFHKESLTNQEDLEKFSDSTISDLQLYSGDQMTFQSKVNTPWISLTSHSSLSVIEVSDFSRHPILQQVALLAHPGITPSVVTIQKSFSFNRFFNTQYVVTFYSDAGDAKTEIVSVALTYFKSSTPGFTRSAVQSYLENNLGRIPTVTEENGLNW